MRTCQHLGAALEIRFNLVGVAYVLDILENATGLGRMDHQCHDKQQIVEVPSQFLPLIGRMQVDSRQDVGIGMQFALGPKSICIVWLTT